MTRFDYMAFPAPDIRETQHTATPGMIDDPVETDRVPPLCPYDFSFAAFLIEPEPGE